MTAWYHRHTGLPETPREHGTAATWHCPTCAVSWSSAVPCWVCGGPAHVGLVPMRYIDDTGDDEAAAS